MRDVSEMGRVHLHGRKVFSRSFVGTVLLWVVVDVVVPSSRRYSRCSSALGNIDNQSFVDILTAGIIGIERLSNWFFRAQGSLGGHVFVVLFPTNYLEDDIWRINASAERIGIFL